MKCNGIEASGRAAGASALAGDLAPPGAGAPAAAELSVGIG